MSDTPIGYWRNSSHSEYPVPVENSASDTQVKTMLENIGRFQKEAALKAYRGWSTCRICGKHNGSEEYAKGRIVMPTGLEHYVRDHKVLVPELLDLYAEKCKNAI